MGDDRVDIIEAWYMCPEHGSQRHVFEIDIANPCHECPPSHVWPKRIVDRQALLDEYPSPQSGNGNESDPT